MSTFYEVTWEELRGVVPTSSGWIENTAMPHVRERVLDLPSKRWPGVVLRMYTSIAVGTDRARSCGSDAIRICAVDVAHNLGVMASRRVYRVKGWRTNLLRVLKEARLKVIRTMELRQHFGEWQPPCPPTSRAAS
jgi:hypothetical protein